MRSTLFLVAVLLAALMPALSFAQDCAPPAIVANKNAGNLFSPEQEMVLGELSLQRVGIDFRFIRDAELQKYVDELGARIVKHLPETGLRYTFHIIDYPDANAFNIPGGHVFLTRKLIAISKNEDELAGVIGHELGHAAVHHATIDISERMRRILNVTSLGDRRDITEKYNLLIENARRKRVSTKGGHESAQQMEADRIGLFAMVAAGYDPKAVFTFFDRLTESEGKTGSWFSDLFGKTKPEQKRLREVQEATDKLPAQCRDGRAATAAEAFLRWQAEVVIYRNKGRAEELPGLLWKKELQPKLRSDINHIAFSDDGKMLLAQDDFSVTVMERDPMKVLFQIPVDGARETSFTPDGKSVVFTTNELRFERWDISTREPVEARELVVRGDCDEHKLAPNGNLLACVNVRDGVAAINLFATKTGERVWEEKKFFELSIFEYFSFISNLLEGDVTTGFFRIEFSPDSKYVMFSRSEMHRYRITLSMGGSDRTQNTAIAVDTDTLKPVKVDGDLKKIASRAYVFLDSQRIVGMTSSNPEESGIFSFPDGRRLDKFAFGGKVISRTQSPDYVVVKPLVQTQLGIFDIKRKMLVSGMNKEDATIHGNFLAFEAASGKIVIREITPASSGIEGKDISSLEIPVGTLGRLTAANVSDNLSWLMLSSKNRGGLWHLSSGERKIFVRGFRGAIVGDDGGGIAYFPRLRDLPQGIGLLNPLNGDVSHIRDMPETGGRQYGRFALVRTSLKAPQKPKEDPKKPKAFNDDEKESQNLYSEVRFDIRDIIQDKVIWSREFPGRAPGFSFDDNSGRMVLYWSLRSDDGKAKLKENPSLAAKAQTMGDKAGDYILEVVDAFAQKTVSTILLETGSGSFRVRNGLSENDWLVLYDSEDRVLVYSLKEGELKYRFFGAHAAINPQRNQVAVQNFPGDVQIYDLNTGNEITKFTFRERAAFIRYNLEGTRLFVLSEGQTAYAFDLNKIAAKPVVME